MELYTGDDTTLLSEFNIGAIIPGLMLGFNVGMLQSLNTLGEQINKIEPGYKLPVVLATWDYTWNDIWLRHVVQEASKFEYIKLHPYKEPYNSPRFHQFVNRFYSNFGITDELGIPTNIFKLLAVNYMVWCGVQHAKVRVVGSDKSKEWFFFKFKSPSFFELHNDHLFNEILNFPLTINNSFFRNERTFMKSLLDVMVVHKITNSSMPELVAAGSLNTFRRVYRLSTNELADELAYFVKQRLYRENLSFSNVSQLDYHMNLPDDGRFEGRYIFSHLVKNTDPPVNYISDSLFSRRIHPQVLLSPKVYIDKKGTYHINDNEVQENLIRMKEESKVKYVIPDRILHSLKYDRF